MSLTIAKIKEAAKNNNIKIPAGMGKDDMLTYLNGAIFERNNQINNAKVKTIPYTDLQPRYADPSISWIDHLHLHGWATTEIPYFDVDYFKNEFFNWLESCCQNFKRDDPATWIDKNLCPNSRGVFKSYFGHEFFQWQIRELCIPIFELIWQTRDLLCSFDGGCFLPSAESDTFKNWFHVDQHRDMPNFSSVQGIVNFNDNNFEDGGLVLIEGSKDVFTTYMDRHQSSGLVWGLEDILDPFIVNLQKIKICAPAGHIILFDSRMFHCNCPPRNLGSYRMCTYVCMQPRYYATEKELKKRIEWYTKGRMTNHWVYSKMLKVCPEKPHTYGKVYNKPAVVHIAELNPVCRRLVGYE